MSQAVGRLPVKTKALSKLAAVHERSAVDRTVAGRIFRRLFWNFPCHDDSKTFPVLFFVLILVLSEGQAGESLRTFKQSNSKFQFMHNVMN